MYFYSNEYADLLGKGDLTVKNTVNITGVELEFSHALARTCFFAHMSLVERIEQTASLYSCSIQGHHVCVLVKALVSNSPLPPPLFLTP